MDRAEYIDLSVWHEEANKLLDHVRLVMSFCSGAMLRAPIIEFYAGHKLEVVVSSQIRQASSASIPVCSYINRQPIFEAAVTSFLSPPFKVKNLSIAIDWFVMDSTYAEVCLVNAMTVLENLISSNLDAKDILILKTDDFRELHKTLKDCIKKYSAEGAEKPKDGLSDLVNHLQNLNRQSIVQKLYILTKLWTVPLDGISRKQIKTAKDARDSIVHRGHYDKDGSNDLWEHVTVVREIVVRFLFTAIGYQGRYISHLGGFHYAQFPPNYTGD